MGDNNPNNPSFGKSLNTWVQTIGIIIAACWGVYTFVYKEIMVPKSAPVNITLNLQLKKIGGAPAKGNLVAVEMRASATNPSSRDIHLLPNAWVAYGIGITAIAGDESDMTKAAVARLADSRNILTVQRHAQPKTASIVATGHLFEDTVLRPNENTARTIVFYVSKDDYDLLDVQAFMPCAADTSKLLLEWTLNDQALQPTVYRVDKKGERTPLPMDKQGNYLDKRLDLQTAESTAEISLWP